MTSPLSPMPSFSLANDSAAPSSTSHKMLVHFTIHVSATGKRSAVSLPAPVSLLNLQSTITNSESLSLESQRLLDSFGRIIDNDAALLVATNSVKAATSSIDSSIIANQSPIAESISSLAPSIDIYVFCTRELNASQQQNHSVNQPSYIPDIQARIDSIKPISLKQVNPLSLHIDLSLIANIARSNSTVCQELLEYSRSFSLYESINESMIQHLDQCKNVNSSIHDILQELIDSAQVLLLHVNREFQSISTEFESLTSNWSTQRSEYEDYFRSFDQHFELLAKMPILHSPFSSPNTESTLRDYLDESKVRRQMIKLREEAEKQAKRIAALTQTHSQLKASLNDLTTSNRKWPSLMPDPWSYEQSLALLSSNRAELRNRLNKILQEKEKLHDFIETFNRMLNPMHPMHSIQFEDSAVKFMATIEPINATIRDDCSVEMQRGRMEPIIKSSHVLIDSLDTITLSMASLQAMSGEFLSSVNDFKGRLALSVDGSNYCRDEYFAVLPNISAWPEAYIHTLNEIRQRRAYSQLLKSFCQDIMQQFTAINEKESVRRSSWHQKYGRIVPTSLANGMTGRCSFVALTLTDFDARLPVIERTNGTKCELISLKPLSTIHLTAAFSLILRLSLSSRQ